MDYYYGDRDSPKYQELVISFEDNGKLTLDNTTVGTITSDWIPLGGTTSRLGSIMISSEEWEELETGFKQVIDEDQDYPRQIKISGKFGDDSIDDWYEIIPGQTKLNKDYKEIKIKITLRKNAN